MFRTSCMARLAGQRCPRKERAKGRNCCLSHALVRDALGSYRVKACSLLDHDDSLHVGVQAALIVVLAGLGKHLRVALPLRQIG
jgi:hypothetical protein